MHRHEAVQRLTHSYPDITGTLHNTAGQLNSWCVESTGRESSHMGVSTTHSGKVWLSLFQIYHKVTKWMTWKWPDQPIKRHDGTWWVRVRKMWSHYGNFARLTEIKAMATGDPTYGLNTSKVCWRNIATSGVVTALLWQHSNNNEWAGDVTTTMSSLMSGGVRGKITGTSSTSQGTMAFKRQFSFTFCLTEVTKNSTLDVLIHVAHNLTTLVPLS